MKASAEKLEQQVLRDARTIERNLRQFDLDNYHDMTRKLGCLTGREAPGRLMAAFQGMDCHHCGIMAAIFADKLPRLDSKRLCQRKLSQEFLRQILDDLSAVKRWDCVCELLQICDEGIRMEWAAGVQAEDVKAVYHALSRWNPTPFHKLLSAWIALVILYGRAQTLKSLLFTKTEALQKDLSNCFQKSKCDYCVLLVGLAHYQRGSACPLCMFRAQLPWVPSLHTCFSADSKDYDQCLQVALEAGLFSSLPRPTLRITEDRDSTLSSTPLGVAAQTLQPDLVRKVYQFATRTPNSVIFWLSQRPALERSRHPLGIPDDHHHCASDLEAAREIRQFLTSKASQPRSLQELCLRDLSSRVGWGQRRVQAVERLNIPQQLKGVLNPWRKNREQSEKERQGRKVGKRKRQGEEGEGRKRRKEGDSA